MAAPQNPCENCSTSNWQALHQHPGKMYAVTTVDVSNPQTPDFKAAVGMITEAYACTNCGTLRLIALPK